MVSNRFKPTTIETAKAIILTPDDTSVENRWQLETDGTFEIIKEFLIDSTCVIDFGCGIGRNIKKIMESDWDKPAFIFGVDSSLEMQKLALQYFTHCDYFIEETIHRCVDDPIVDLIISTYVFQHIPKQELIPIVSDMHRVLKPGGKLFVINMKGRCLPIDTIQEQIHATTGKLDSVINDIANYRIPNAWGQDDFNVKNYLSNVFGEPEVIDPDPKYFSELTRKNHDFLVFTK